jgi:hypothetical protein
MAFPYTYLASFMNQPFRQTVAAAALREIASAPGPLRQQLERAVRAAHLSAPGYRPGKIPLPQVAKPIVTPLSRASDASPFTTRDDLAHAVFSLWLHAQPELRGRVAAFLTEKGRTVHDELPAAGLDGELKIADMEALAAELGASSETDPATYDNTALMLVLLLAQAPVPDAEEE